MANETNVKITPNGEKIVEELDKLSEADFITTLRKCNKLASKFVKK